MWYNICMDEYIRIRGAKENNLKSVDLDIPRDKLVVFTGVSGSGKSTLAFDTIFAEGQRRYMESLSSYARMFLGQYQKPDVEMITGLSPSISIDQKTTNHNPRSTVGTVTEIYDYIRLLFSRIGKPFCPKCNKEINQQTVDQIVDKVLSYENGSKIMVLAPVVRNKKGAFAKLFESLQKDGYARVIVDGQTRLLEEKIDLDKNLKHTIDVVVDRLIIKEEIVSRLSESIETALNLAEGLVVVASGEERELFSTNFACPECGYSIEEITPRMFSFNNPYGACPNCTGLGYTQDIDEKLVLKNGHLSIRQGAFNLTGWMFDGGNIAFQYYKALSEQYNIDLDTPVNELPRKQLDILLYADNNEPIKLKVNAKMGGTYTGNFEGLINNLKRRFVESSSEYIKMEISKLMREQECCVCHGKRLNESALNIRIDGKNISDYTSMSVKDLREYIEKLKLDNSQQIIAEPIIKEIKARLTFLIDVGLGYLTLARSANSLSGGESQRIRLATQIGSGLVGVLYILDEPSIGLHQRDNDKLLATLKKLRDLGNTLIVVEHDEDTIKDADFVVDVGPLAGVNGGEIICQGTVDDLKKCPNSITGRFISGKEKIDIPLDRKKTEKGFISIKGAKQNNLKNIDVDIPKGVFTVITGVSGSGKSSLVNGVLYPVLANMLNRANVPFGKYDKISNIEDLDKVIMIDQSPIGKTPRSNPATYTGLFTPLRELLATTKTAKEKGYTAGRFSFNVKGGRCEHCGGAGVKEIEMYFLSDITVPCEVCKGKRYNRETLEVKYKNKNIADILDMTVEESLSYFENIPAIYSKLKALNDVGLGYIKLGQPATQLSGGEAQRVKLATELCKKSTGKTVYILDEPTTGLHMYDVKKLIKILQTLVDNGNTVIVIEHNLDVIKNADYIIDLGPEGGDAGGQIVCKGTPEEVAKNPASFTGKYLKKIL